MWVPGYRPCRHGYCPAEVPPFAEVVGIRILLYNRGHPYSWAICCCRQRCRQQGHCPVTGSHCRLGCKARALHTHTLSSSPSSLMVVSWDRPHRSYTKTWRVLHATLLRKRKCHRCRVEPGGPPHIKPSKISDCFGQKSNWGPSKKKAGAAPKAPGVPLTIAYRFFFHCAAE